MRTTLHDRHRCAQNVDHLARNPPIFSPFAEVVCTLGTTPFTLTHQTGGIALHEAPTHRRHAARGLHVVQNPPPPPAWRAPEEPEGLTAAPVGGEAWPDNEPKRRSKLAARTAEAGGSDTTASQISHATPPATRIDTSSKTAEYQRLEPKPRHVLTGIACGTDG